MTALKTYRVVLAQSVLSEHIVQAVSREAAENIAYDAYRKPAGLFLATQRLSDGLETIDIEEAAS
jgi:hypothetical protein